MAIPAGVILVWPSTNASIPSEWARETTLDTKYLKAPAAGVDPTTTGGSNTHTHTSPSHTHTLDSHTHSGNTKTPDTSGSWRKDASNTSGGMSNDNHRHNFTSSAITGGDLVDATSYQSVNQEPPYFEVIFIKPSGAYAVLKQNIIAFSNKATPFTNWYFCDGTNGTPDLRNKYLKGAAASGNAGGTGGSLTHTHTVDHTHSAVNHSHSGTTGAATGNDPPDERGSGGGGTEVVNKNHFHGFTLADTSINGGAYTGTVTSGTVEPAYTKLSPVQLGLVSAQVPKNLIGIWLDTISNIPKGWVLCDGTNGTTDMRGQYLKCANTMAEAGNTGGSNTHSHSSSNSHTHTSAGSHTHTLSVAQVSGANVSDSGGFYAIQAEHVHTSGSDSIDSKTPTWQNASISGDSTNNEPTYRTAAFIQYVRTTGGGSLFAIL